LDLGQAVVIRSCSEIADAIRTFTPADWVRLKLTAKKYAFRRNFSPDDLLQEAMRRALEEKDGRKCPTHIDVVKFLAEAMRSIADGEAEKVENQMTFIPVANHSGQQDGEIDLVDSRPNPEETFDAKQNEATITKALCAPFDDDPQAREIVEGILAGFNGEELRKLTSLDKTAYDSKRKLIRRRIDKIYPKDLSHDIK